MTQLRSPIFQNKARRDFCRNQRGLFLLDDTQPEQKFSRIQINVPGVANEAFSVYALTEDAEGNLWIGHEHGLTRRNPEGKTVTYAVTQPNE